MQALARSPCLVEARSDGETVDQAPKTDVFAAAFQQAPFGIFVVGTNLRVIDVNPRLAKFAGTTVEALIGFDVRQLKDKRVQDAIVRALSGETVKYEGPYERSFDGPEFTRVHVSPLREEDRVVGALGFFEDITAEVKERETNETLRRVMQARLLQSDRMASLGTLAAGIAHEINNPLAYVKANLDLLSRRRLPRIRLRAAALENEQLGRALLGHIDEIVQMVELAREGAERVRTIVADLRTFSRAEDAVSAAVDLARVLDASANLAASEIAGRARLEKDYGDVAMVWANESRVGQVFLNLLVNAAHAIPAGDPARNTIRLRLRQNGDNAHIVISDTGAGIPEELLARVFDPFFTTKPIGEGTGLGLWICQGIVASLGGQIHLSSSVVGPKRGTTVEVTLPLRAAPPIALRR